MNQNKKTAVNFPNFFTLPHNISGRSAENILVGLSGGCDSTLLLTLLCKYSELYGITLYAAHINHNIRTNAYNNEASRDEMFCRELCERLGIELFVLNADLPHLAEEMGESLETAARRVRYDFFAKIMKKKDIPLLATAHNANDNLETQLFNLVRGCGIDGICGIPPSRQFCGGLLIRPLLNATKSEIYEYCREHGIEYVTDSSNLVPDCSRNKIRLEVIPRLEEIFPEPQIASIRLSRAAREDAAYLDNTAKEFMRTSVHEGKCALDTLLDLHPSILRRVLCKMYESSSGSSSMLEAVHTDALSLLCRRRMPRSSLSLPQNVTAYIDADRKFLIFSIGEQTDPISQTKGYFQKLSMGLNIIENTPFAIYVQMGEHTHTAPDTYSHLSCARLYMITPDDLYVSSRREGDKITDGGISKRVKKLLCDKKIPLSLRDTLPIVTTHDGEPLYIPMCAICDRVKKKNSANTDIYTYISIYIKEDISGGQL